MCYCYTFNSSIQFNIKIKFYPHDFSGNLQAFRFVVSLFQRFMSYLCGSLLHAVAVLGHKMNVFLLILCFITKSISQKGKCLFHIFVLFIPSDSNLLILHIGRGHVIDGATICFLSSFPKQNCFFFLFHSFVQITTKLDSSTFTVAKRQQREKRNCTPSKIKRRNNKCRVFLFPWSAELKQRELLTGKIRFWSPLSATN